MKDFTIEPTDHWRLGDRAYCVEGLSRDGRHIVEEGKIYSVTEARQFVGMMNDGLKLAGIELQFWSGRFVCLRGDPPYMRQIASRTSRSWYTAYCTCRDARSAVPAGEASNV